MNVPPAAPPLKLIPVMLTGWFSTTTLPIAPDHAAGRALAATPEFATAMSTPSYSYRVLGAPFPRPPGGALDDGAGDLALGAGAAGRAERHGVDPAQRAHPHHLPAGLGEQLGQLV